MKAKQEDAVKAREQEMAQKRAREDEFRRNEAQNKERDKRNAASKLSFNMDDDDDDEDGDEVEIPKFVKSKPKPIPPTAAIIKPEGEESSEDLKVKLETESIKEESIDQVKDEDSNSNDKLTASKTSKTLPKMIKRVTKNPDVDTSFLPDRDREVQEKALREKLRLEWVERQESLKNEVIEIVYSYWDGSGHRRSVTCRKGHTIYQFLQKALDALKKEFPELRIVSADQLMYIKEDLIIPHHYTFYDFIVTKARGKSGPLFAFDVHDDVRLVADANVEKDESHAGKVLLRSWYDRNKHIFPASRWEPYDPAKNYSKYTISDKSK